MKQDILCSSIGKYDINNKIKVNKGYKINLKITPKMNKISTLYQSCP